jgi:hypothetical protein
MGREANDGGTKRCGTARIELPAYERGGVPPTPAHRLSHLRLVAKVVGIMVTWVVEMLLGIIGYHKNKLYAVADC